jgi:hypothetical protein
MGLISSVLIGLWTSASYRRKVPKMKHLRSIALVAAISVLAALVVYGAVMAVYRIAQAQSWPPALTNLSPFIALAAVWFLIGRPVTRVLKRRAERLQQSSTRIGEANPPQRTLTKSELIWKIGVLYWGGLMMLLILCYRRSAHPTLYYGQAAYDARIHERPVHLLNHLFSGWRHIRLVNVAKREAHSQSKRMSRKRQGPCRTAAGE